MRSAVVRNGSLVIRDDVPEPVPLQGEVLVEVEACGICGADLHFVSHGHEMTERLGEMERLPPVGVTPPDLTRDVFIGHEFAGRVVALGPDTTGPAVGTLVTSIPLLLPSGTPRELAFNNDFPAGYSELMRLSSPLAIPVPAGVPASSVALTEPMAVGLHAVNRSGLKPGDGAVVIGCGPVGLAVVAALRVRGDVEPIIASDYSPTRRALALTMGADAAVDASEEDVLSSWDDKSGGRDLVLFEAVGVPGVINDLMRRAPLRTRLVVVGLCMKPDAFTPMFGIAKELAVQFVIGYTPEEFAECLTAISSGRLDVSPMITGEVGLADLAIAFNELADPERHCKIVCRPRDRSLMGITAPQP